MCAYVSVCAYVSKCVCICEYVCAYMCECLKNYVRECVCEREQNKNCTLTTLSPFVPYIRHSLTLSLADSLTTHKLTYSHTMHHSLTQLPLVRTFYPLYTQPPYSPQTQTHTTRSNEQHSTTLSASSCYYAWVLS